VPAHALSVAPLSAQPVAGEAGVRLVSGIALLALALLPWQGDDSGFFAFHWVSAWPWGTAAPASVRVLRGGEVWLAPLVLPALVVLFSPGRRLTATVLMGCGLLALCWLVLVAMSVGLRGWTWALPDTLFGPLPRRNAGLGAGAFVFGSAAIALTGTGAARAGAMRGDVFAAILLGYVLALMALFVVYPLARLGMGSLQSVRGQWAPELFWPRIADPRIWREGGPFRTTVLLGLASASTSTILALAFSLLTERGFARGRRVLRTLSILPIITPPFVVGLSVILLFGRNGSVNHLLEAAFGITPTRWVYGFKGVWFAQTLAFTPIAYLVLVGILKGMSPALEEAAQTLRGSPQRIFRTITIPLALPGLANAFLVVFAQSLADFGNPLLLGGDMQVLATAVYFAVVGARQDRGVAAVLALILLGLMLVVFLGQRALLSGRAFTTVLGKSQGGTPLPLPGLLQTACSAIAWPWAGLTLVVYGAILFGGFVENWGLDNSLTLKHYRAAFGVDLGGGLSFTGQAWGSLGTTAILAAIAAPLTAGAGLAIAYLVSRTRFRGRSSLEFVALVAGAVPGTVLGISYVLAFNNPPLDLVQTAAILVISFVVRNMGPGLRAGVAGLSQIDTSLDEASVTLRAGGFRTAWSVLLPLLRPVLFAGLVHGFVAAMTTVSAVIFLVSPGLTLATVYIVNLAEAGTYGMAIAASSVLLAAMLAVILVADRFAGDKVAR
jgi:iron(III) transport system permease protein